MGTPEPFRVHRVALGRLLVPAASWPSPILLRHIQCIVLTLDRCLQRHWLQGIILPALILLHAVRAR